MRKRDNEKENTNLHEKVCKIVHAKENANEDSNADEKENDNGIQSEKENVSTKETHNET